MTEVVGTLKGGRAAAERAAKEKAEREARRSASYSLWSYLQLEAAPTGEVYGGSGIYRIVTDEPDWAEAKQHSFIPTKPAPRDLPEGKKWLSRFGAVCRYTLVPKRAANGEIVISEWYPDCYICDEVWLPGKNGKPDYHPKASPRQWAWAVEQEEYEEDGETKYRDMMVEHKDNDGNVTLVQKWVVLNFAMENFFDKLLGYNNVYKTVVDRPYKITRKGSGTDTDYEIIALDPQFEDGEKVDLRKEKFAARYQPPVELFSIIEKQASDEHYQWFFDARVETTWEGRFGKKEDSSSDAGSSSTSTASAASNDDAEATQHRETLEAMRQRMKSKAKAGV